MTGRDALAGLRVVDLSNVRTGAQASQVLADFGAGVIHVDPPAEAPCAARRRGVAGDAASRAFSST